MGLIIISIKKKIAIKKDQSIKKPLNLSFTPLREPLHSTFVSFSFTKPAKNNLLNAQAENTKLINKRSLINPCVTRINK